MEQSDNYFSIEIANKTGKIDRLQSHPSISIQWKGRWHCGTMAKKIIRIVNCNEGDVRRETEEPVMRENS